MMNKTIHILLFLSLALSNLEVQAQSDQFYFIGSIAPVPSLSEAGDKAVYLRWDALETPLPAQVQTLVIKRNDQQIISLPAHALMSAAQIQALYQEAGQERRLAEMLAWLRAQDPSLTPAGLGAAVANQLAHDELWAMLASRIDFNVARARYRGFLDRDYAEATFPLRYELLGRDAADAEQRLGFITLTANQVTPLPAAKDLRPVMQSRCDAPERALDHGSVALDWTHGGTGAVQAFASELGIAGYDLYRSVQNTDKNGGFAYRSLSRGPHIRGFDATGQLVIDSLEKVNDQPIMIAGSGPTQDETFAQFKESLPELRARNVHPGDVRDYYLVARDFTGHYGEAARLKVEVPDLLPPISPWNVELRQSSTEQQLQFRWDAINAANYINFFGSGQTICNADSARADQRVLVLGAGQQCGVDTPVEHKLTTDGYLIYRFTRFDQAAAFTDTDGDGYSDQDERVPVSACSDDPQDPIRRAYRSNPANPNDFQCTQPATACDASRTPAQGVSHLLATLPASAATRQANHKQIMQFSAPVQAPGDVYWYRFASYSDSAGQRRVSELSPPLRAKFNDYTQPERSVLAGLVGAYLPNEACWDYQTSLQPAAAPKALAFDHTGDAREISLGCEYEGSAKPGAAPSRLLQLPVSRDGGVALNAEACALIRSACVVPGRGEPSLNVWFLGSAGQLLGAPQTLSSFLAEQCETSQQVDLVSVPKPNLKGNLCPAYRPLAPGERSRRIPLFRINNLPEDQCISIYRKINGKDVRIQQTCGPFDGDVDLTDLDLPDMQLGGEPMCFSSSLHNENNRVSARHSLGCVSLADHVGRAPRPPQVLDLEYQDQSAIIRWRRPQEPTSATVIEVLDGNGPDARVMLVRTIGHSDAGLDAVEDFDAQGGQGAAALIQTAEIDLGGDPAAGERTYCVRLRSVSSGAWEDVSTTLSERTPTLCKTRMPPGQPLPEYMAWPQQGLPTQGQDLSAVWVGEPLILLSGGTLQGTPQNCTDRVSMVRDDKDQTLCWQQQVDVTQTHAGNSSEACRVSLKRECPDAREQNLNQNVCGQFQESLRGRLNFVVYRQSRSAETAPASDYYQVSPLLDRMHCESGVLEGRFESELGDPFILPLLVNSDPAGFITAFTDQYPYISGQQYRYQLVYFDAFGEISQTRLTNWLTIP